ncbi:tripartite tricarboxylate transporter substrate binding protein [Pseudacidovorax sp. RU35E]|uniref:tripartite tricarboxylate transporter substrate binding protein n=1 Tax=Pseudacidovorax sp. RU35E TaxID=1907403 RepID=UPI000970B2BC|nr:tripartite tricarboxylate transporter substrate binding protein [Pseudacidovorax sp. RU35E]
MQPQSPTRRTFLAGIAALAAGSAAGRVAAAESWSPGPRVEFLVPSGPGAALDASARKLARLLEQQRLSPAVVVSNRSSAHGVVVLQALQQAERNPNVLATLSSSLVYSEAQGALPVPYTEFTPLATLLTEYVVVAVRADSPLRTGSDLIARLRQDPTALSIGIATTLGNHIHLGIARPLKAGQVDVTRLRVIPYKSSAESLTALLGGHLDVISATTPNVVGQLKAGAIRLLAVAAPQRLGGVFADAPTWREQGVNAVGQSVQGVMAPKGISATQQAYWTRALREVTQTPDWKDFLVLNQWQDNFQGPQDTATQLAAEYREVRALLAELRLVQA